MFVIRLFHELIELCAGNMCYRANIIYRTMLTRESGNVPQGPV